MPAAKTYVDIKKPTVVAVFDDKYKSSLPDILSKALDKAVKAAGTLATDKPKDKNAKGYTLDVSLESLAPDKAGTKLLASCSMAISTWPGKAVQAMPKAKPALPVDGPDKIVAADVQAVAEAAIAGVMKEAAKYIDKNPP